MYVCTYICIDTYIYIDTLPALFGKYSAILCLGQYVSNFVVFSLNKFLKPKF